MAAIIGPQRGGLTVAGADQLWQSQSVPGGPFMAREIAIAGPPGPISAADHPLRDSTFHYIATPTSTVYTLWTHSYMSYRTHFILLSFHYRYICLLVVSCTGYEWLVKK